MLCLEVYNKLFRRCDIIDSKSIYGEYWDETELQTMMYIPALFRKLHSAEEVLAGLLTKPYAENNDLINEVVKAITFNQKLIDKCLGRKEIE